MKENRQGNELRLISHLILLITMGIFSAMLIVLNRILEWELWMIPVIIMGTIICWAMHISHRMPERVQTYICGIFLIFLTFYYTVNSDTLYDNTALIIILIFLFAFQGETILAVLEVIAGYLGIVLQMFLMQGLELDRMDTVHVIRSGWQLALIPLAAVLADRIAEAWKNAEKEYQHRIDEVMVENNRVNDFLANVSHEIRTPVNAVMGLSSVLEKMDLPEAIRGNVAAISEAGHRVAEQIGDLLDFTEIDMGKLSVSRENYMINSLINDLLVQLSFTGNYGLDLVIDMEADIPAGLVGDGSKIRKILWHLIGNGFKFTREGGVYVHIYPVKREYGINLVMEIKDTGTGMTEEQIEHIYEKFYQSDSGRSRTAGGLGLGISIVNGFTKAMGGVLSIESVPKEGTTVRVSIPQEVEDESSCISVGDKENCVAAGFLGFMTTGHPKIRGYYMEMIAHLVSGLSISFHRVQSRKELENLIASVKVSHLFVGTGEYLENREYIDRLADEMNVAVVADQGFAGPVGSRIAMLPKPFYGAQVANVLNHSFDEMESSRKERMVCPGLRTLVVDDEPMNLLVAKGIFEDYGMVVTTALGGQEAVDLCGREDFDIIFMDHMMPEMDGVEAMKRLRINASKDKKELCIVALTANAISSAKEMFLSEGFDGFVPKPIEITELERVLKHVLPKSAIVYHREGFQKEIPPEREMPAGKARDKYETLGDCGVDVGQGLKYCQDDRDFYDQLLLEYAKDGGKKVKELQAFYEDGKWKDYAIRIHAVKSTSKLIGAVKLSDTARLLEEASKQENVDELRKTHPVFLPLYQQLMEKIVGLSGHDEESLGQDGDAGDILEFEPVGGADEDVLEFRPEGSDI